MNKSLCFRLLGALSLSAVLTLSACSGGGGDPGTPLFNPTSKFIMTPVISGLSMGIGQFVEPVKISGGQKPYYVGSDTGCVVPTLLDDGTLFLQSYCSNLEPTDTDCASNPPSQYIWVQDSSYNNGTGTLNPTLKIQICVEHLPPLLSSLGATPSITLSPGGSQTFTVYNGAAPYTAVSNNPAVASVSGGANGVFTITAGYTTGNASILVMDANNSTFTVTVDNTVATALAVSPTTLTGVTGNVMSLSIVGGAAPYKAVSSNPSVATASVSGSAVSVSLIGVGSSTITIEDATGTIVPVTVTVAVSFAAIPPIQTLTGGTTSPITFLLVNGTGPFYVTVPTTVGSSAVPTSSLISVSPMVIPSATTSSAAASSAAASSTTASFTVSLVPGVCIASNKTISLTVTDSATGKTAIATVQIQGNDSSPGCL